MQPQWPPHRLEREVPLVKSMLGDDEAHGWPHVERVARLALRIAVDLGSVDYDVLGASVLYHDLGRPLERVLGAHHALLSARLAKARLETLGWEREKIALVENAILSHSYSLSKSIGVKPESVEAMILSDADKLDALGAIGIARVIITGAHVGRSICDSLEHLKSKIIRLPGLLYTKPAKRMADKLRVIVEHYVESLEEELGFHELCSSSDHS